MPSQTDRIYVGRNSGLVTPQGNGDPTAVAAPTSPGAGYTAIPTVAFANAGSGSGATLTALMGVVSATVVAGGSGGTNGAVTITGADGTGTKFQATGTIASGALTGPLTVTVAGSYSALPASITADPVTGGSLTGATVALSFGVVGFSAVGGASNHQYPAGTTVALTGGTPTTAAVPGAVTITSVAGQGATLVVANRALPAKYGVWVTTSDDRRHWITNKTNVGFTINFAPGLAANTLAAGTCDVLIIH